MTELIYYFFELRPAVVSRLMSIGISDHSGGWQNLIRFFQSRCQLGNGSFSINEAEYQRLKRYCRGQGGYQDCFKAIFRCEVK